MSAPEPSTHGLSIHRIDALTDGIYAVAMTLLVIELKLPENHAIQTSADLADALGALWPKFYAWFISFFVMALFWMGHHRSHDPLRHTTSGLITLNIVQLALVSLMPFSCALLGEHATLLSQVVFAGNMLLLAASSLLTSTYIYRHPALAVHPMAKGVYVGAAIRVIGLIVISICTVLIQSRLEGGYGIGNVAFALMAVLVPLSRRVERSIDAGQPR